MTFGRLLLRNLFYHWRGNLAVLLGVAVGTAVLTGALLVGDSLRGSLQDLTLQRLGWVDHALVASRFFREDLAGELAADGAGERISPVLLLRGAVTSQGTSPDSGGRAGQVTLLGVDQRFWPEGQTPVDADFWQSTSEEVVLNAKLAGDLGVSPGDKVVVHLPLVSAVPREAFLGNREADKSIDRLTLTVREVLQDDRFGNRFQLNPGTMAPRNAFVPLRLLQDELNQVTPGQEKRKPPRLNLDRPVNGLLVGGGTDRLEEGLAKHLRLEDWGLVLRDPQQRADAFFRSLDRNHDGRLTATEWPRLKEEAFTRQIDRDHDGQVSRDEMIAYYRDHHPYLNLESRQLFLEPAVAAAAGTAAEKTGLREAPTLVYLADSVADATAPRKEMAYAVVAALDPTLPAPLGPFLPPGVDRLEDDDIVLADWPGSLLPPGSPVKQVVLKYYDPEEQDRLRESPPLRLRGWVALKDAADDPDLTPEFPGITDQVSLADWDPPESLHYDKSRVRYTDEEYWKNYRTTPKAYLNLATGQKLWSSRFGKLTSVRLAPQAGAVPTKEMADNFQGRLLENLKPAQGGLVFDAIRERALKSSAGGTDFGFLFLAFSLFLIVAALLLVGLLFRLNLDRRAGEIGVLLATGIRRGTLGRLLLGEGSLLAVAGGLVGLGGAILYAWLLLEYLRKSWPGSLDQSFLRLHVTPTSFLVGYGAALLVSVLTIAWATLVLARVSPRALLAGETSEETGPDRRRRMSAWSQLVALALVVCAGVCVAAGSFARDPEIQAGSFFGSGLLLLIASLMGVWAFLRRGAAVRSHRLATLGVRNAGRHPVRSLLTVGLLASATFLVVAVQSFHQDPGRDFLDKYSGSGGFPLLAESDVPIFLDLQTPRGRTDLDDALELARVPPEERTVFDGVTFTSFRLRAGEDASCLNLYQPGRPRLLGIPHALVERGGFQFQETEARSEEERRNPWLLLEQEQSDGAVPVFGEANTVTWMLKKGLGQELEVPDESGEPVRLRFVGLLQNSIFQSEVLLSDANFRKLYPHQEGYQFFLIGAPAGKARQVQKLLEKALADHGLTVMPTRDRLEAYLSVENTYLSTFQALGGLGLLLGALGLAVVLLRSIWERRGELALFRALGFRKTALGWLVLAENGFLLVLGVGVGCVTALIAVAPHLTGGAEGVPWLRLLGLMGLVLAVGLAAGTAAVAATLRAPLVPALRRE